MFEDSDQRAAGASGKITIRGILHGMADQVHALKILRPAFSLDDIVQDLPEFHGTDAARDTLAAGDPLIEFKEVAGHLHHAIVLINGGDKPGIPIVKKTARGGF